MSHGAHPLNQAIDAARANDEDTLRGLIDWPVASAGSFCRALGRLPESMRAEVAASGLAELATAASRPEVTMQYLTDLAPLLLGARDITGAAEPRRGEVLSALRVASTPAGLTPDQVAGLDALRARTALLTEVYLVRGDAGEVAIALAPDTGLLVPLLPAP